MIGKKWWPVSAFVAAAFLGGCKPSEDVRTYTVEKEPERTAPTKSEVPAGEIKFRLLGAIIPAPNGLSWFVRFSGPPELVAAHEEDFNKFLTSIRVTDDRAAPLAWTVPLGWTVDTKRQMRTVTLNKGEAEFYISNPFGGSILQNVNSWRADIVGIEKVGESELSKVTTEVMLGTAKATRVDFRGPGGKGRAGGGPFSGK